MYQPYPTGSQPPGPSRPQPPGPVRIAALFMYAGAAVSLANAIAVILTLSAYRAAIRHAYPRYTEARVHAIANSGVVVSMVLAAVEIFLWLWLAWACRNGKIWGRITGTVLFAVSTLLLLVPLLARARAGVFPTATLGTLLAVLLWAAGLGAVIMLWRRESTAYFSASRD